jgi:hypothetical protein
LICKHEISSEKTSPLILSSKSAEGFVQYRLLTPTSHDIDDTLPFLEIEGEDDFDSLLAGEGEIERRGALEKFFSCSDESEFDCASG